MAVVNGHAYGAGFILALCHDFRIMSSSRARVCLVEINLGFDLGSAGFVASSKDTLTKKSFRELILGIAWQGPEAKRGDVVNEIFTGKEECEA